MKEMFANFQKYDEKGRRMNIFCQVNSDNTLRVYTFSCSKVDEFSKKKAWNLFERWSAVVDGDAILDDYSNLPKVTVLNIPIVDNKPKKTFINWCNDNFYHLTEQQIRYTRVLLINKFNHKIRVKDIANGGGKMAYR